MSKKVYVVVQDGYPDAYGVNMYLIGVFDCKEDAVMAGECSNNPNYRRVIEIEKNREFPLMPTFLGHKIFNYKNDYHIGGYAE